MLHVNQVLTGSKSLKCECYFLLEMQNVSTIYVIKLNGVNLNKVYAKHYQTKLYEIKSDQNKER